MKSLGATTVLDRKDFEGKPRALNKELFAGGIDVAGGEILANILSMIKKYGKYEFLCLIRQQSTFIETIQLNSKLK